MCSIRTFPQHSLTYIYLWLRGCIVGWNYVFPSGYPVSKRGIRLKDSTRMDEFLVLGTLYDLYRLFLSTYSRYCLFLLYYPALHLPHDGSEEGFCEYAYEYDDYGPAAAVGFKSQLLNCSAMFRGFFPCCTCICPCWLVSVPAFPETVSVRPVAFLVGPVSVPVGKFKSLLVC